MDAARVAAVEEEGRGRLVAATTVEELRAAETEVLGRN